jgi:hypothetical protein
MKLINYLFYLFIYLMNILKFGIRKNLVFKFTNKHFLEKFIKRNKIFVQYKKIDPEMIQYYEPEEPIIFKENKYLLIQSNFNSTMNNIVQYCGLLPATVISAYKLIKSIMGYRIFSSLIWGGIFLLSTRLIVGFTQNKYFMIEKMNLKEDGKSIEIITMADKFIADISDIRKITPDEALDIAVLLGGNDFVPIVIKDEVFIVSRNASVFNQALFVAISNGNYIKLTNEKKVGKDDTIDIE